MPTKTASHSNSGYLRNSSLYEEFGKDAFHRDGVHFLDTDAGTASRVLPENNQIRPVSLRSTRSTTMSTSP